MANALTGNHCKMPLMCPLFILVFNNEHVPRKIMSFIMHSGFSLLQVNLSFSPCVEKSCFVRFVLTSL